jgi:hypothetical protein
MSTRAESWFLAALTHLRLVVEYYVIIQNRLLSHSLQGALAQLQNKYFDGLWLAWCRTDYDLESRPRTCILKLPIPLRGIGKGHAVARKILTIYIPEILVRPLTCYPTQRHSSKSHADGRDSLA